MATKIQRMPPPASPQSSGDVSEQKSNSYQGTPRGANGEVAQTPSSILSISVAFASPGQASVTSVTPSRVLHPAEPSSHLVTPQTTFQNYSTEPAVAGRTPMSAFDGATPKVNLSQLDSAALGAAAGAASMDPMEEASHTLAGRSPMSPMREDEDPDAPPAAAAQPSTAAGADQAASAAADGAAAAAPHDASLSAQSATSQPGSDGASAFPNALAAFLGGVGHTGRPAVAQLAANVPTPENIAHIKSVHQDYAQHLHLLDSTINALSGGTPPKPTAKGKKAAAAAAAAAAGDGTTVPAGSGATPAKKKKETPPSDASCQAQIECGVQLPDGTRQMHAHVPFFGKVVEIYLAVGDPKGQHLYRASAVADKFGYATNKVGMYLARRRMNNSGIYQATSFKAKPPGRTGLKAGGYFLTMDACLEFEHHFRQHDEMLGIPQAPLPSSHAQHAQQAQHQVQQQALIAQMNAAAAAQAAHAGGSAQIAAAGQAQGLAIQVPAAAAKKDDGAEDSPLNGATRRSKRSPRPPQPSDASVPEVSSPSGRKRSALAASTSSPRHDAGAEAEATANLAMLAQMSPAPVGSHDPNAEAAAQKSSARKRNAANAMDGGQRVAKPKRVRTAALKVEPTSLEMAHQSGTYQPGLSPLSPMSGGGSPTDGGAADGNMPPPDHSLHNPYQLQHGITPFQAEHYMQRNAQIHAQHHQQMHMMPPQQRLGYSSQAHSFAALASPPGQGRMYSYANSPAMPSGSGGGGVFGATPIAGGGNFPGATPGGAQGGFMGLQSPNPFQQPMGTPGAPHLSQPPQPSPPASSGGNKNMSIALPGSSAAPHAAHHLHHALHTPMGGPAQGSGLSSVMGGPGVGGGGGPGGSFLGHGQTPFPLATPLPGGPLGGMQSPTGSFSPFPSSSTGQLVGGAPHASAGPTQGLSGHGLMSPQFGLMSPPNPPHNVGGSHPSQGLHVQHTLQHPQGSQHQLGAPATPVGSSFGPSAFSSLAHSGLLSPYPGGSPSAPMSSPLPLSMLPAPQNSPQASPELDFKLQDISASPTLQPPASASAEPVKME